MLWIYKKITFSKLAVSNTTVWMLMICMKKKQDGNCRMLHHTKLHLTNHLKKKKKKKKEKIWGHVGNCWRSKNQLISDILWTSTHGHTSVGWSAKTHISSVQKKTLDVVWRTCKEWWTIQRDRDVHTVSATW